MESERWKKASLAISSIIRGLELDQVMFQYDEAAGDQLTSLPGISPIAASYSRPERTGAQSSNASVRSELRAN